MATVTKRGGTYQIKVSMGFDSQGKRIQKTTTWKPDPSIHRTEKQIKKALDIFALDFERRAKSGRMIDGDRLKFEDFIREDYLPNYAKGRMSPTSYERTVSLFEIIILKHLGHLKLNEIKPKHLEKLYNDMLTGIRVNYKDCEAERSYSIGTIKRTHRSISSALSYALKNDMVIQNVCSKADVPKSYEVEEKENFFSLAEAKAFMNYLKESDSVSLQNELFLTLAISCGARRGEILALTWDDVNLESGLIKINKSASFPKTGRLIKTPKNLHSVREVPIPRECIKLLKAWKVEQKKLELMYKQYWKGNTEKAIFIQEQNGRPMRVETPYKCLKTVIKNYNRLDEELKLPDIPLHGLRHTAGSIMISSGIPIPTVSRLLGHADITTTLKVYTHVVETYEEKIQSVMSEVLFA